MVLIDQFYYYALLPFLHGYNHFIVTYFLFLNAFYSLMLLLAFAVIKKRLRHLQFVELKKVFQSPFFKPVSVLMPAYNEEASIVDSLKAILQLQYPKFEIVLINDGSKDNTLKRLIEHYNLIPSQRIIRKQLPCKNILAIYKSPNHPNLMVIDKENGGKADALNAGINASQYPLFCAIDSDTILERDVLLKIVRPFIEDRRTIAVGGTVRIVNGCSMKNGIITEMILPENMLARFQILEYLRAFLSGRVAFSALKCLLIISGAFGIFRKDKVLEAGGYRAESIGEDMELVVRLHEKFGNGREPYNLVFIPEAVCWTEAPETHAVLKKQRTRWQRGLLESLTGHMRMFLNPSYGVIGLMAFPFYLFFEGFGPIIELTGVVLFLLSWCFQLVDYELAVLFFLGAVVLNILLTIGSVIFEEILFNRNYPRLRLKEVLILCLLSFLESFYYRPLNAWWRCIGIFQFMAGKKGGWGNMERRGFQKMN